MDLEEAEQWLNPSSGNELGQQKWDNSTSTTSILDYCIGIDTAFPELSPTSQPRLRIPNNRDTEMRDEGVTEWDPKTILSNLCFLEQKIHQLQDLVHLIVGRRSQEAVLGPRDKLAAQQQQQLVTADVTSIIAQLISTAGSLLPCMTTTTASAGQPVVVQPQNTKQPQHNNNLLVDEHEMKDEEDIDEGESLVPGTYEILQLEKEEILAPHTHFCAICGKGFKRDANLRMHMRGHGDEYKTPAALAKPHKESGSEPLVTKRYSCPFVGCKRNKDHKKFQPLKTILCVKNHYKRTHCDKSYTCSRCKTKKFSVIADLKTHEKHCGKDKWLCSCGTTFSRKDKLFGHISLFQGHTPAIPVDEMKSTGEAKNNKGSASSASLNFGSNPQTDIDVKEGLDDPSGFFSPMNFETCNFGGFHEFPRPLYEEDSDSSFSFLLPGSCNYPNKTVGDSTTNNLE